MSWLYLGIGMLLLSAMFDFELSAPESTRKSFADLWRSFGIRFNRLDGVDFGASLGKLTGLFWIAVNLLVESFPEVRLSGIGSALVFFIPAWLSAIAWRRSLPVLRAG